MHHKCAATNVHTQARFLCVRYLLLRESLRSQLPLMYFALQTWVHNRRWIDFRESGRTLPDEHVLSSHRITDAMQAEVAATAYEEHATNLDGFLCGSCERWGWKETISGELNLLSARTFGCCEKLDYKQSG